MWDPSTEAAHSGTPHVSLNPLTASCKASPVQKWTYTGRSFVQMLYMSLGQSGKVYCERYTPNRWAML